MKTLLTGLFASCSMALAAIALPCTASADDTNREAEFAANTFASEIEVFEGDTVEVETFDIETFEGDAYESTVETVVSGDGYEILEVNPRDIRLDTPNYGGNGCPRGTVATTLSTDRKTLSILFDQYIAEVGGATGKTFDRKSCNLAIPVSVPQGYSLSLLSIDYRGFNFLPNAGARSTFRVEYFFAGQQGPVFNRQFRGPLDRDFTITNRIGVRAMVWSRCGQQVILRTNSSLRVRAPSGAEAIASVDSQDVRSAIVYHLQWRRC